MIHVHDIIDTDGPFVIDAVSRSIISESKKISIVQYDHNSERFTFSVPRYIEEHDMSQCNRIIVNYTNITRNKKEQHDDAYIVTDISSDRDTVFFSWLVSRNATQLVGSLKFSVSFICYDAEGNEEFNWGTDIFDSIQVIARLDHVASIIEKNPDLLEQLKQEILNEVPSSGNGEVDPAEVERVVKEYLEANPPAQGQPGKDGEDGYTPIRGVDYFTDDDIAFIAAEAAKLVDVGNATVESIDAEKVFFSSDLTTTHAIGNITLTNGQATIAATGKNLKQVWESIFVQEQNPTTTNPSVTVTSSQAKAHEVGTKLTPSYSATFDPGSYTYGPDTGVTVESWEITDTAGNKSSNPSGSFAELTVIPNLSYKITAKANYKEGTIPVTNTGNPYESGQIKAGSASASTSTAITGYRNSFYGTLTEKKDLTSDVIRGLTKSNKALSNGNGFTITVPVGAMRVVIAYPATLRDLNSVKDVNGLNAEIGSGFTSQTIAVEGANNYEAIDYKVYIMDFATANDKANKFTVTI